MSFIIHQNPGESGTRSRAGGTEAATPCYPLKDSPHNLNTSLSPVQFHLTRPVLGANRQIGSIPHLSVFLEGEGRVVVGWGRKPSGARAAVLARLLRRRCLLIEDGFLRSVARQGPLLSLLVDDLGVYYDASAPSRMETTIAAGVMGAEATRAAALIDQWVCAGLSKYNHAPELGRALPETYILVVDQCFGDLSVRCGLAHAESFAVMLAAALVENPTMQVLVKCHPEVLAGRRRGYLAEMALVDPRVTVIGEECHPIRLIEGAHTVYTVTSLMGFEALLRGKTVRCFGMPFYAGWGLTEDALPPPARRGRATLTDLAHAAFVSLARYVDPVLGVGITPETAIKAAAEERAALLAAFRPDHPASA